MIPDCFRDFCDCIPLSEEVPNEVETIVGL